MSVRELARISIFAAVYALLTVLPPLNALGYGLCGQGHEALAVLPFIPVGAVGVYRFGQQGPLWQIYRLGFRSLAANPTRRMPAQYWHPSPVIVNAVLVSMYVAPLSGLPYVSVALYIAAGQAAACYGVGYPASYLLKRWGVTLWAERGARISPVTRRPGLRMIESISPPPLCDRGDWARRLLTGQAWKSSRFPAYAVGADGVGRGRI